MENMLLSNWLAASRTYLGILVSSLTLVNGRAAGHWSLLEAPTVVAHTIKSAAMGRRMTSCALRRWSRISRGVVQVVGL